MQSKSLFLSLALGLASSTLLAGQFEGVARYKVLGKDAKKGQEMEFSIKGDKVRMDMSAKGQEGSMIMDMKSKEAITLMPKEKSYMVMKLDGKAPKAGKGKAGKLVKSGKTETIAGYVAEEWVYEGGKDKASLWGNKDLGSWTFSGGPQGKGPQMEIPAAFKDGGFFPLRMVSDNGGMEAVKVEKKSLAASLFEVPAGYKKMDMGGMMGGHEGHDHSGHSHGGMSAEQKKEMEEAMKGMSPAERAMMEKMMKGR